MKHKRRREGGCSIISDLWSFIEILLGIVVIFGGVGTVFFLAQRWYVQRNGQKRPEKYANAAHRKISLWFSVLMLPLVFIINLDGAYVPLIFLAIFGPCFLLYMAVGTYLWKQVSNNKDNYRYEWLSMGGTVVWLIFITICLQWLGAGPLL